MRGVLLVNLGTPDAPETGPVRRYLREFLMDRRVVDLNPVGRTLLVEGAILPFRPAKSAEAYQKVWTQQGSPLLVFSQQLAERLQQALGADFAVELAMRYGNPPIRPALKKLQEKGVESILVAPLYPQYASATTGSTVEAVFEALAPEENIPAFSVLPAFYDEPAVLEAYAQQVRATVASSNADHVLFSFHGLPERQVRRADPTGKHCLQSASCCDRLGVENRDCYRAQAFATARGIAARLSLPADGWSVSFQSRLGRTPWIGPYTDVVLPELAQKGKKRIAVACPAFVADCLETLEEIAIRGREQWHSLGGEELTLVPSLNATQPWVDALAALVRRHALPPRAQPLTPLSAGQPDARGR